MSNKTDKVALDYNSKYKLNIGVHTDKKKNTTPPIWINNKSIYIKA